MDTRHFDAMARSLTEVGTRRRLLGLLAILPVLRDLVVLFDADETAAQGRRRRRKKRHKHGRPRRHGRRKRQRCHPESKAKTCADACGLVKNTCKKMVDCGSCACNPPCGECFICNEATQICEPDPDRQGDACGELGQVCRANGDCVCDDASCAVCAICQNDGVCSRPCGGSGCCDDAETCQPGSADDACGTDGDTCVVCSNPTSICVNNVCTEPAGIALTKSSDAVGNFVLGEVITYTFLVENTGQIDLEEIVVGDPLPGLSPITCSGTSLAVGASFACTATYVVTQADVDAGRIANIATVTGVASGNVEVTDVDSLVIPPV